MNLDELRSVRRTERQKDSLQHLRDSFYEDVANYIAERKAERKRAADAAEDPFGDPEVGQLTDEIETAEDVVEAIYERRVGKVVKLASFAAADMSADTNGLTAEERELFQGLVARIKQNRQNVLNVLAGEGGDGAGGESSAATGNSSPGTAATASSQPESADPAEAEPAETAPTETHLNDPDDPEAVSPDDVLADAMRFTPGNALFFFPSYSEAERYHDRLRSRVDVDGAVLRDGPDVDTESLRRRFVDDDGAALFTSLWGTLAEGVSFDGDDARTVAVVGVPYPHLSERMEAVQEAYERAYEDRNGAGWRYAVEIPTIRKTRQALGRVIRSPEDFGVRLLVDKRYTQASADMGKYGVRESFPREESAELVDVAPDKLKFAMLNFYGDLDAYEGEPPQP